MKIGGSIIGNTTHAVLIIARGQNVKLASGFDIAIASVTVGGSVQHAQILAGYLIDGLDGSIDPVNADASIGAVSVGRSWVGSDLVAGARNAGTLGFGVGDALQATGNTALIARIASITIRGDVSGSRAAGDNFGFVAEQIDKLRIGSRTITLVPGPSNPADNFLISLTDDVHLLEAS